MAPRLPGNKSNVIFSLITLHPWASYQIRKVAGCACAVNAGNVFPRHRLQWKPLFSDPGMHHGTCVTHVPLCMSGSLTSGGGENVPGIPGACAPAILNIWKEVHAGMLLADLASSYRCIINSVALQNSCLPEIGWNENIVPPTCSCGNVKCHFDIKKKPRCTSDKFTWVTYW